MRENEDITKTLYEYRDFIEYNYDIILAVNMNDYNYEQIVYRRPDFYSASERGNAIVLYESLLPLLFTPEDEEDVIFSPDSVKKFYLSPSKTLSSQKVKLTHRNGARWVQVRLVKAEKYPEYVFVCVKEITHDLQFWDITDLLKVVGSKYSSILSINVTLNECHLITGNDMSYSKRAGSVASYTKFLEGLANGAATAYRNEIRSKLSQAFLLAKAGEDRSLEVLEYPDERGEHWYALQFRYVRSMLNDNVTGLLFIACIDDEIKEKRERANLNYQLFTIGHRLFKMYISVDLDADRYCINRFDGDKRYNALLEGSYSQNVGAIFKYVPEGERRRILSENSLDKLKDRFYDGDFVDRTYTFTTLDKDGEKREIELIVGVSSAEEKAGAFIAVRDVTEQNLLKRTEEREKEIINLLGKNYNLAFIMDVSSMRISYLKRPAYSKNVFHDNCEYKDMIEKLCDVYVAEEDQEYVSTMARPENVLKEIRRNGYFRFSHKWRKDGNLYWTEWTIMPLPSDPSSLLGQAKNITEEYAAELRRIRSEAELRQLKVKNDELHQLITTDEFGLGNMASYEKYRLGSKGGAVVYIVINDWYNYYRNGEFKSIVKNAVESFTPSEAFRFGGGDIVLIVNEPDEKRVEAFANYVRENGVSAEVGFDVDENINTAVKTAYENKKRI